MSFLVRVWNVFFLVPWTVYLNDICFPLFCQAFLDGASCVSSELCTRQAVKYRKRGFALRAFCPLRIRRHFTCLPLVCNWLFATVFRRPVYVAYFNLFHYILNISVSQFFIQLTQIRNYRVAWNFREFPNKNQRKCTPFIYWMSIKLIANYLSTTTYFLHSCNGESLLMFSG